METSPACVRTLRLLEALAASSEPVAASVLARRLDLPRSTTYRLLATMAEHGYVTHLRESGRWALGASAYELAWAYQRQTPLQRMARPLLARLVDQVGHNAHLAVLQGKDVLYVIEERAPRRPSLVTDVGVRLPAEVTASGRAMLAAMTPAQISALYPSNAVLVVRNGRGPGTVVALRRELAATRRRGYSVEEGSVTEGLSSYAVAVVDHGGYPVAAVAVTFADADVDPHERTRIARRVGHCAAALTARAGR